MKQLSRTYRLALVCALFAAAGAEGAVGGNAASAPKPTAAEKAATKDADAIAKAKADKAAADATAKAEKQAKAKQDKLDKAEADKKAKADKKVADDAAKADGIAKREADAKAKTEAAAKAKQDKVDAAAKKKADKEAADLLAKEAKEKNKQPEQNGVRRPKPDGLCGRAWAHMDKLTLDRGGNPVPIAALLTVTTADGLLEGNVRAEYARWRKFNGITGRIVDAKPEAPVETPAAESGTATA